MELVENRIVHRFIRNIAEYETGEYSNTVIGTDVQAYAIYPETEEGGKSGLYYVIGDDIHTYTEIRDGQGATLAAKEYPVFSEDFIGEIDKCATKEEIDAAVAVEKERAESAEATLNDAINTETERATTKEKEIEDKHTQEITAIEGTITAINEALTDHKNNRENPHVVTKEQVGLGNVDNTADLDKPVSTAVSEEIKKVNTAITSEADRAKQVEADLNIAIENEVTRAKGIEAELTKEITDEALRATEAEGNITTALNAHKDDVNNPHDVTKAQLGLGNVDNTSDVNKPISSATQEALDNITSSVEAEVTRAESAEKVLDTSIKAEVTRATEAEASLTTEIKKKANKATTLAGYNISDAYTKTEVDGKLAGAFHYKGTVETEADLPKEGNEQGDVWNVSETGANYAWDGEKFDKLSETIDLSAYALKTDLPTKVSELENDAGYLTQHQSLDNYYTKEETDTKLTEKANQTDLENLHSDVIYIADTRLPEMVENTTTALDTKVQWDSQKKVISLPIDGSISALREVSPEEGTQPEGDVLIAQRSYDNFQTLVTEVGTTKNKLTLNASERPQVDIAGGSSEKLAFQSEIPDISGKADKTEIPTELPNPNALMLKVNNEDFVVYNGSEAVEKNLEIYADNIPLNSGTSLTVAWQLERLTPMFIQIPIRSLQDKVYTQEEIFGWFGVTDVIGIKNKFGLPVPVYMMYNVTFSGLPHVYKFPVEYAAFESQNQIKMVFQGLNTMNDVVSKYEIIINLDGTVIEGNSNVKMTITSLEPSA